MSINLRLATKADVPELVEIEHSLFETDQISKRQFIYHTKSKKNIFIVAESHNKLIGYILTFTRSKSARIYSLAVAKKAQGKGVAFLLFQDVLKYLPNEIKLLTLEVNINNVAAITFYKKAGFVIKKVLESYYQNGDNAYKMSKSL